MKVSTGGHTRATVDPNDESLDRNYKFSFIHLLSIRRPSLVSVSSGIPSMRASTTNAIPIAAVMLMVGIIFRIIRSAWIDEKLSEYLSLTKREHLSEDFNDNTFLLGKLNDLERKMNVLIQETAGKNLEAAKGCVYDNAKAQDGEDKYAFDNFFNNVSALDNGFFIEVGAIAGLTLSTTYAFEKCLGWRGLLIEPHPKNFRELIVNRPNAQKLNLAACKETADGREKRIAFTEGNGATGAALNEAPPSFLKQWHGSSNASQIRTIDVACGSYWKYFSLLGIQHVDFFSIDVEGAELSLIETIDWNLINVRVVLVEADHHNPEKNIAVREVMKQNGFTLTENEFIKSSDVFVKHEYDRLRQKGIAYKQWLP